MRERKLTSDAVARTGRERTGANGTMPSLTELLLALLRSETTTLIASPAFAAMEVLKLPSAATLTAGALALLASLRTTSVIGAAPAIAPAVPATVAVVAPRVIVVRSTFTCGAAATVKVIRRSSAATMPSCARMATSHAACGEVMIVPSCCGAVGVVASTMPMPPVSSASMTRLFAAPATSSRFPKFEFVCRPTTVAVPLRVRLPLASGVPAVGRT